MPLAFDTESQEGVYPLVWMRGMWSMLISFGDSIEDCRAKLEEAKKIVYS